MVHSVAPFHIVALSHRSETAKTMRFCDLGPLIVCNLLMLLVVSVVAIELCA